MRFPSPRTHRSAAGLACARLVSAASLSLVVACSAHSPPGSRAEPRAAMAPTPRPDSNGAQDASVFAATGPEAEAAAAERELLRSLPPGAEFSQGCGVATTGQPIGLDEAIPGHGFRARDLAQRIAQMPRLPLEFAPWWKAPSAKPGEALVTLEVIPGDTARWNGQQLELDVRMRLWAPVEARGSARERDVEPDRDPGAAQPNKPGQGRKLSGWLIEVAGVATAVPNAEAGESLRARRAGPRSTGSDGLGESWIRASFEAPELARRWTLPPAAPPQGMPPKPPIAFDSASSSGLVGSNAGGSGTYDTFHVGVAWSPNQSGSPGVPPRAWSGQLHSVRAGTHCELARSAAPATTRCDAWTGLLVVPDESAVREIRLSDAVTASFTPRAALAALEHLPPLYADWPDGDLEGKRTQIRIQARALGFACAVPASVPVQAADRPMSYAPGFRVVTPVELTVSSDDGRLRASLSGIVEALPITGRRWDESMTLAVGAPLSQLAARKEKPGFVPPHAGIGSLGLTLYMPVTEDIISQLSMSVWQPYPGVPDYPAVSELASNRLHCFASPDFRAMREAHLSHKP
jgi:hypothetical protein